MPVAHVSETIKKIKLKPMTNLRKKAPLKDIQVGDLLYSRTGNVALVREVREDTTILSPLSDLSTTFEPKWYQSWSTDPMDISVNRNIKPNIDMDIVYTIGMGLLLLPLVVAMLIIALGSLNEKN